MAAVAAVLGTQLGCRFTDGGEVVRSVKQWTEQGYQSGMLEDMSILLCFVLLLCELCLWQHEI